MKFIHKISKGSKFNQIYVPREAEREFEVGDLVEVKLLKKKTELHYSQKSIELSKFKEKLIKEIFEFFSEYEKVKACFIFGSFLTKKIDYNDIDLLVIVEKKDEIFENRLYDKLIDEFNLKFHVICIEENKLNNLLKINPLIRSMIYYSVSNKKIEDLPKIEIDEKNIKFTLMLPEDVLDVDVNSRMLYDSLRRVLLLKFFIKKEEISLFEIDQEIINLLGQDLYEDIRKDSIISPFNQKKIKAIIGEKIKFIENKLKK